MRALSWALFFSLITVTCFAQVGPGGFTPRSIQSVTDGTNTCYPYQLKVSSNSCSNGVATISGGGTGGFVTAPTSPTSSCTAGQYSSDSSYFYICNPTNTWLRTAIATWSPSQLYVTYLGVNATYLGMNMTYLGQ